jgi:hypothetical protein
MRVLVVGDGLLDVAFQPVDGQVHLRQADGGGVLFQPIEGELVDRVFLLALDEAGTLDEHTAGTAGRVQNGAPFGFEDVGDERDQRNRCEKLAGVVGFLVGELGEEVLIDATKYIAGDTLEFIRVECAEELTEHTVVQFLVFALWQNAPEVVVVALNGLHRLDDSSGAIVAVREGNQVVELCLRLQEDGALLGEVFLGQCPRLAAALWKVCFNDVLDRQEPAVCVPQKYQAHDGQEVLIACIV